MLQGSATWHARRFTVAISAPSAPMAGDVVQFTALPTGGRQTITYDWDFGDGSAHGTGVSPQHTYATAGTVTVVLTATDANGRVATASVALAVEALLTATMSPASPVAALAGVLVAFSCTPSGGQAPYTYVWDFGDGTQATGQNVSHAYAAAANGLMCQVTVTDAVGHTAAVSATVNVGLHIVLPGGQILYRTAAQIQAGVTLSSSWLNSNNSPIIGGTPPYHTEWTGDDYSQILADGKGITHASNVVYYFGGHTISLFVTDANGFNGGSAEFFTIYASAP